MKQSIRDKLEGLAGRLDELDRTLSSSEATRDMDQYRKLTREHAELGPVVALYQTWRQAEADLQSALDMMTDPEMKELAEAEMKSASERLPEIERELQNLLLPKDSADERNVFLEIRAGTGGDESALFAGNLFRMYSRFAERQRWQVEVVSSSASDVGGYKEVIARIVGNGVYSRLKFESGTHRVQSVPETVYCSHNAGSRRTGRRPDQSGGDSHRYFSRIGRWWAAHQQDRLGDPYRSFADRHRCRMPGRSFAA